uniref:Uncharacterized protein n=1 Tax=Aegilops tauschii TaxID=37682 RepID=M8B7U3_AEGTA
MAVAAARCLILTPTVSSSAVLRLPRIARRRPLSCSASPLAVFATMESPPEGYRTNAPNWLTYDFPADVKDKLNARWGTNWKGQAQKCHEAKSMRNQMPDAIAKEKKEKIRFQVQAVDQSEKHDMI